MADFKGLSMTNTGISILNTLSNITFTTARTTSSIVDLTTVAGMTTLPNVQQSADVITKTPSNNQTQVNIMFTNTKITTQYNIQAIGLYANDQNGKEQLFAVGVLGQSESMPPISSAPSSFEVDMIISIAQGNVNITVSQAGFALQSDITAVKAQLTAGDQVTLTSAQNYTNQQIANQAPQVLTGSYDLNNSPTGTQTSEGATLVHGPQTGGQWAIINTVRYNGSNGYQIYTDTNSGNTWKRTQSAGSWNSWVQLATYSTKIQNAYHADQADNATAANTATTAQTATNATNAQTATTALTANALAVAQPITLTGDATGSTTFNGSTGSSMSVTVNHAKNADNATNSANSVNSNLAQTANKLTKPFTLNLATDATGSVSIDGSSDQTLNVHVNRADSADSAGGALTANKLQTPRKINGVPFAGDSDITINANPEIRTISSADDLFSLPSGVYYSDAQTPKNAPDGITAWAIYTIDNFTSSNSTIVAQDTNSSKMWINSKGGGAWSGWKQLATSDTVATAQQLAQTAENDAQTGISNASQAQATANTANSNAQTAQLTANQALSNAQTANNAINSAQTVNILNTTGADLFNLPSFGQYVFLAGATNANGARELKNLPPVNLQNFYGGFTLTYSPTSAGTKMIELRRNVQGKYVSDTDSVVYIASNGSGTWKWLV